MIKNLSEKELGHSFFYSLKLHDFQHAYNLLKLGAPINTSYFTNQNQLTYTLNLLVARATQITKKYGTAHSKSKLLMRIIDRCLQQKPDLRCHCTKRYPHHCPLAQAFKFIQFEQESDLLLDSNLLILKLLLNGATYKNLNNSIHYKWVGLTILTNYITSNKPQVIERLKITTYPKPPPHNPNHRSTKCTLTLPASPCKS